MDLYRKYYRFSDTATLLQLYRSLVRPHLDYAAPVWDPHLQRDIQLLEGVQKFACRMCSKAWKTGYEELQSTLQLSSLSNRRLFLKLCTIFKVLHGLCYFPQNVFSARETRSHVCRPILLPELIPISILLSLIPFSNGIIYLNMSSVVLLCIPLKNHLCIILIALTTNSLSFVSLLITFVVGYIVD